MKRCSHCKELKEDHEYSRAQNSSNGLQGYCKACALEYDKKYRRSYWKASKAVVYSITAPEGTVYIGSTLTWNSRHRVHMSTLRYHKHRNPTLLDLSYKYEPEEFVFEIITEVDKALPNYMTTLRSFEQREIDAHPECCNVLAAKVEE